MLWHIQFQDLRLLLGHSVGPMSHQHRLRLLCHFFGRMKHALETQYMNNTWPGWRSSHCNGLTHHGCQSVHVFAWQCIPCWLCLYVCVKNELCIMCLFFFSKKLLIPFWRDMKYLSSIIWQWCLLKWCGHSLASLWEALARRNLFFTMECKFGCWSRNHT